MGARIFLNKLRGHVVTADTRRVPILFARLAKRVGDGDHRCALWSRGAAGVSERSQAVGAESHPSKNEGWGTRRSSPIQRSHGCSRLIHLYTRTRSVQSCSTQSDRTKPERPDGQVSSSPSRLL